MAGARLRWFLKHVLRRRAADRDLDDEIRAHLAIRAEQRIEAGESPQEAWRNTRREFGNEVLIREITRDTWGLVIVERLLQDLRYALRRLRRSPGFTIVACTTLALGIGVSTAIFSVVDSVLFRPLPYPQSDRVVSFAWRMPTSVGPANITPATFAHWQRHATSFDAFAITSYSTYTMTRDRSAERLPVVPATCDFFRVLSVAPQHGRPFAGDDCADGAPPVVVLSRRLSSRLFGENNGVGATVVLNDRAFTVIGVMPDTFRSEPDAEMWVPLHVEGDPRDRGLNYMAVGRLRGGVLWEQAQAETAGLFASFIAENPRHSPRGAQSLELMRLQDFLSADLRTPLLLLFGSVLLVLAIASGNVANLLLARTSATARDLAIRTALGAARTRLIAQTLTECVVLAAFGGAGGLALAMAGVPALVRAMPRQLPRFGEVAIDWRVVAFSAAVSVTLSIVFAVLASMRVLKAHPSTVLKASAGTGIDATKHRLSNALVCVEVALSVMLLVGAGLLASTFLNLRTIPLGFETDGILTLQLFPGAAKFGTSDAGTRLDAQLIDRISQVPGVAAVTTTASLPLERGPNFIFGIEGDPPDQAAYVELRAVGPRYLSTLGIPLRAGRELNEADAMNSIPVAVVNQALAETLGGNQLALGRRLVIGPGTPSGGALREIVGVAANVSDGRPGTRLFPTIYLPRTQFVSGTTVALVVRGRPDVPIAGGVRDAVLGIDPSLLIGRVRSMREVASGALAQQRFNMIIIAIFATTALTLAMIGLYGLLSYQVVQRTREIGVRIALGANRFDVLRLVVGRGLILTIVGLLIGSGAALGLARFVRTMLFGVTTTSPWIYASVAGLLLTVAFVASLVPARRAMRADALVALRSE
jgi:putative ABC transport system permease protein